jgi:4-hydroxy-3-methylbut-2-enyl diphosphate reductase
VNQTTMLASDTQAIADYVKETMIRKYDLTEETIKERFADTRDTLCYATNDNQTAVTGMLHTNADFAIVVGGYNSSNTSHLVELCEEKIPTYFISNEEKILSPQTILHYDFHTKTELVTENYLPDKQSVSVLVTSGASCPDALVEGIIKKLAGFYPTSKSIEEITAQFQ